jgi:hypothetical protein
MRNGMRNAHSHRFMTEETFYEIISPDSGLNACAWPLCCASPNLAYHGSSGSNLTGSNSPCQTKQPYFASG